MIKKHVKLVVFIVFTGGLVLSGAGYICTYSADHVCLYQNGI